MELLKITNLTDNPTQLITNNFLSAFENVEKELKEDDEDYICLSETSKLDYIDSQINFLIDQIGDAPAKYLQSLVDHYLVNYDYEEDVREFINNN